MPSIRAIVKPELLRWARESIHLTIEVSALKIGVSIDRLQSWESGGSAPTIPQLRKAAEVYKRPLAVFFLAEPPKTFDALRDFRRLQAPTRPSQSPELTLAIRLARSQREILLGVAEDSKVDLPEIDAKFEKLRTSAEAFAAEARRLLGVSWESQYSWRQPHDALNRWVRALEELGVLVFQTSEVEPEEMRGFAIYEKKLPVIVVNAKDSPRARIFTLLHEFVHILLRQSPLCDLREETASIPGDAAIEVFCNRAAGNMLVSADALNREIKLLDFGTRNPSSSDIEFLARRFSVSREVVVRRLLAIGRVSLGFYQAKRDEYATAYRKATQKEGGFAPPVVVKVRNLGRLYVRTVIDAYRQEIITTADVSNYLGLKVKHLPKAEQIAYKSLG